MKHFFTVSSTAFLFSSTLWIIWSFFSVQTSLLPNWLASLIYFPHAARVLCIVYFGWRAIPGLYLAEIWGPIFIAPEVYNFNVFFPSLMSVISVSLALGLLNTLDLKLGNTNTSPLNKRNYKHIALITILSAVFNGLFVNFYLSTMNVNFFSAIDASIIQVIRFIVGDIVGTAIVFIGLATFLRPIIAKKY